MTGPHPGDVLEVQMSGVLQVDVGLRRAVDLELPAAGEPGGDDARASVPSERRACGISSGSCRARAIHPRQIARAGEAHPLPEKEKPRPLEIEGLRRHPTRVAGKDRQI